MSPDKCEFSKGDPALFDGCGAVVVSDPIPRYGWRGEFQGYTLMVQTRGRSDGIQLSVMDNELKTVG